MKMEELMMNEEIMVALDNAETESEFVGILKQNGLNDEEIAHFINLIKAASEGELDAEQLELVAGGGNPIIQRWLSKWYYRGVNGKWFCYTTYNEDTRTITVTNRFGEKVSQDFPY